MTGVRVRFQHILLFAVIAIAAASAAAAPPQQGRLAGTLASIKITGSQHYTSDQVGQAAGLKVGQAVDRDALQAAADRLAQLGLFSKVNYRYTTSPDQGVDLEFVLEDAPSVPVDFDNFPWFTDEELTAALRQSVFLFDGTAPQAGTILDQMSAALEALLPSRGVQGKVEWTLIAQPVGDGMMMQFRVEGASLPIESVQFGDALATDSPTLRDRLSDILGKPFSRYTLELFENEEIAPRYLEAGHLHVKFGQPLPRFTGDPNGPPPKSLVVIFPIEPGPVYHWAGAQWTGNNVLDAASLDGLIGLKPGDVANGMQITGSWQRIQDAYGQRGRLDAKLTPVAMFNEAGARVSYSITIEEGPLYRMGDLIITGLSLDAENRVRLAWHLLQAQIFDAQYCDQFLDKLQKPTREIFGDLPVHYNDVGHWVRKDPDKHIADVLLDFK
jgi:outer membrane protein assembly factor BamA